MKYTTLRSLPGLIGLAMVYLVLSGCAIGTPNNAMAGPSGPSGHSGPSGPSGRKVANASQSLDRLSLAPRGLFDVHQPRRQIHSLMVVGDSLSISLAEQMEFNLSQATRLSFAKLGKVSSGLARPDFFDWDRHMEEMAARNRPDAVVVMIGANDNQHLRQADGSLIYFGTPEWDRAYAAKVRRVVDTCRRYNPKATIFWMGAPVMASQALSQDLRHINALVAAVMERNRDCHYVDTWRLFSGQSGEFVRAKAEVAGGQPLRARDGIHLTPAGAQALAETCLNALGRQVAWEQLPSSASL